jgi:hypothetical protein
VDRSNVNGGFPLPLAEQPARLVASRHDACGAETRVRLPQAVPSRAVRRVVCDRCSQPYKPAIVQDVVADEVVSPRRAGGWRPGWRWLGLPVAAAAVIGVLLLVQGGDEPGESTPSPVADQTEATTEVAAERSRSANRAANGAGAGAAGAPGDAQLISEATFQLALPADWEQATPSGGATFAATAPGGEADVMLWVEHDPKLDFSTFEARSLAQLESLAGSAGVVERNPGPTPATTSSTLAPTSAPNDAPNYEVVVGGGPGDYWYYLATTSQSGASAEALDGIELVQGSFLPQGGRG